MGSRQFRSYHFIPAPRPLVESSRIWCISVSRGRFVASRFFAPLPIPRSMSDAEPTYLRPPIIAHTQVLLDSFRSRVGRDLIDRSGDPADESLRLFEAPFVVVSHGTQADPILNYGNRVALELWETDFASLTAMPSRLTAEAPEREERARLLERTARDGYVDDYRGVRISTSGRRFLIEQAIVWNLVDATGRAVGQAATFARWKILNGGKP